MSSSSAFGEHILAQCLDRFTRDDLAPYRRLNGDLVHLPWNEFLHFLGKLTPTLRHIRKLAAVMTYGATPMRAFLVGNPPKKIVNRVLRAQIKIGAPVKYLAHYDMNNCTEETRAAFMAKVRREMENF